MKWYWKIGGTHVHARVFMNGVNCGNLCFTKGEWYEVRRVYGRMIKFVREEKA